MFEVAAQKRDLLVGRWLERTVQSYPDQTAKFLRDTKDPFRNPVGQALKQGLPVLFDELLGGMQRERIMPVLDGIVRIRAVQDFTPSQAVAFVFLLKRILREELGGDSVIAALESRIDELALLAFDLFVQCREKIYELKVQEARRSTYVAARLSMPGRGREGTV